MAITTSYLVAVGKLGELLGAILKAQAPERFTIKFLGDLGYKSTNDRLFIGLLKALGFLDQSGKPQQRYFDYLDDTQSKQVLAEGIQEAYEDLFRVNTSAHVMTQQQVKSKLKSLTQGQHSDKILSNMARTFMALVECADFASPRRTAPEEAKPNDIADTESGETAAEATPAGIPNVPRQGDRLIDSLAYRIEVVLPPTRDKAVYDAIFKSLKEHLL